MAGRRALPDFAELKRLLTVAWDGGRVTRAALVASAVWVVLVLAYGLGFFAAGGAVERGTVFLDGVFFLIALFLPLLLIWLAAGLALELARQREAIDLLLQASAPLIGALEATRGVLETRGPVSEADIHRAVQGAIRGAQPDLSGPIGQIRAAQKEMQALLAALQTRPPAPAEAAFAPASSLPPATEAAPPKPRRPRPMTDAAGQPSLPLAGAEEAPPRPGWPELVRALDFPKDADDGEGFEALRVALRHPSLAQMLQAAEDVLTMLSQEGVYTEDLTPEPGDPTAWRRFIDGRRGPGVAGVGGIRDERAMTAARALMKADSVFRDTALFFQRRFDVVLSEYATEASDAELLALADTRSGRAFQLLARLNGSFE